MLRVPLANVCGWIGSIFCSVYVTIWCLIHVMPQISGCGRQYMCRAPRETVKAFDTK
jgi:hypothetical protein